MRKLALLLVIAAAGIGVWVMIVSRGTEPAPIGVSPEQETERSQTGTLTGELAESEPGIDVTKAEAERVEVRTTEAEAGDLELVRVLVTRSDTDEPVPGAEVRYYENEIAVSFSHAERAEYARLSPDMEKLTARLGTRVLADGNGVVTIPVRQHVRATGRHGELYGQIDIRRSIQDNATEYRLELERDISFAVQVLDFRGDPAVEVPVSIHPLRVGQGEWGDQSELGRTRAPEGLVNVAHLQMVLEGWEREIPRPTGYLLRPDIPGLTEGQVLDPQMPPEDLVVFRLPQTGRVLVETTDAAGTKLPAELLRRTVTLAIPAEGGFLQDPSSEHPIERDAQWTGRREEDGTAVFERVVAGRTYLASSRPAWNYTETLFRGPVAEDQEVRVRLALPQGLYFLVGRALNEAREPIADRSLALDYRIEPGTTGSNFTFRTDPQGNFKINFTTGGRTGGTLSQVAIRDAASGVAYTWRGSRKLEAGEMDLGEVVLTPGFLVASGRVLVNGGAPREEHFDIQIQGGNPPRSGSSTAVQWRQDRELRLLVQGDGRFEVRGDPQWSRFRLLLRNANYLPVRPIEFAPGAVGLVFELIDGGTLDAELLVDESVSLEELRVSVIPLDGQELETRPDPGDSMAMYRIDNWLLGSRSRRTSRGQAFHWRALWPGRYRLEVRTAGASTPVVSIPDVHIAVGERNRDPRLEPIDLRRKLRTISITMVDPDRELIAPETSSPLALVHDPDAEEMYGFGHRRNPATILTGEPYLDLLVVARGYKPREISGVTADMEVMLEPFPEVVVRIPGGLPALPDDISLRLRISRIGDRGQRDPRRVVLENGGGPLSSWLEPGTSTQEFSETGEVALPVSGDGTYALRASLQRGRNPAVTIRDVEPAEIEVRTALGQQVFEITIPAQALRQAVVEAGKR